MKTVLIPAKFLYIAFALLAMATALFAIPVDKARAHNDNSAMFHAERNPLHESVYAGNLDSVNHFITEHMANVDAKNVSTDLINDEGARPLHWAISGNCLDCIAILLNEGANINARDGNGDTPLHSVTRGRFFNAEANKHKKPIVAMLIAAGANINARDLGGGGVDIYSGKTPLHLAARSNPELVPVLLAAQPKRFFAKKANVNAKDSGGRTPLHLAAGNSSESAVSALLAAGAHVNAKTTETNPGGYTPLHIADNAPIVSALVEAGADVWEKDSDGNTPLHWAASGNDSKVVSALLAAGVPVNAINNNDGTPLHKAASYGKVAIVSALIAAGANVNAVNNYGDTPLLRAVSRGHISVVFALIAAGGAKRIIAIGFAVLMALFAVAALVAWIRKKIPEWEHEAIRRKVRRDLRRKQIVDKIHAEEASKIR